MKLTPRTLALFSAGLLVWAAGWQAAAQTIIADGSSVVLESAVDEWGFPSFESQALRLTFVRPQASGLELLPLGLSWPDNLYALFTNGTRRVSVNLPLNVFVSQMTEEERVAAVTLTPWSPDLSSTFGLQWGDDLLPGGKREYAYVELPDQRAPATLDYAGTFSDEDPHEAAAIGRPFDQRDETTLADFRRLAGLPPDFAPWTVLTNFDPKFFVAQADGLIVAASGPASDVEARLHGGPPPRRYRRDGTEDTSFTPTAGSGILGQLPDGRFLGALVGDIHDEYNRPRKLIAFAGTNLAQAELLAFMGPRYIPAYRTQSRVVQFAIIHQDGSMILDQGVRPRGCYFDDNAEAIGLPSLNGERLRGTRARLFWKAPVPSCFAFRQLRRSRAVRESAGSVTVEVRRLGDLTQLQRVQVSTADGSAKAGLNYTATSGRLEFSPGQVSQSIQVPILPAGVCRSSLDFTLKLAAGWPERPDANTSAEMVATPRHTVTIQGGVRLEWATPNRVRVWNPPYQFTVRAFGSLDLNEVFGVSANQYSPATDYFDLDLTAVPTLDALPTLDGFSGWQPFNATPRTLLL